jgi:5-oxoprolinase (ATP-hydrolysing)
MTAGGSAQWDFWIDVGGTFTDCIARLPDGTLRTHKLLSTGRYPCSADAAATAAVWRAFPLPAAPPGYFLGYRFACLLPDHGEVVRTVTGFDAAAGTLTFDVPLPAAPLPGTRGELFSDEEAPVAGIRWLLGLRLDQPIGPVRVRLGTTRATNALLERRGARTALVATAGFGDALRIGYQDRPHLFELRIAQPPELSKSVLEVSERLSAEGRVLKPLDASAARVALAKLRADGIESLAVCLLHAYRNPLHEEQIGQIAAELGFRHVSLSSRVSPLPKLIYRGDTTLLDAYVTPVLRDYCRSLAAQLPGADLRFMTSAGSLVRLEDFSGKDAILSGPAGGVAGLARITDRAGLAPAFAFDMGGTSTDVSRWNGTALARRYETEAGGSSGVRRMRLQSSMLEIETVAAGGGSICWFDGEKLAVGPHSAGASPGPACYGSGGPLTVTDLNFWLGRLPRFPFPLDPAPVGHRLDELRGALAAAGHSAPTRDDLAAGCLRIANAAMAAPIKKLAAARGEDVRTHTLVAFGGAGGQHACALARELGMQRILCSPHAGVLSALGIGLAGISRFAEQALAPGEDPIAAFHGLEANLRALLAGEGVPTGKTDPPLRTLEMRYRGQETRLAVPEPADGDFAAAFIRQHRQLFNFVFPGREIEAYAARVELGALPEAFPGAPEPPGRAEREPVPAFVTRAWHDDSGWQDTPVFERADLRPGARIAGPAIILEAIATVIVEPGWTAGVTARDDLLLEGATTRQPGRSPYSPERADPVELELFHQRFSSVAEQMGAVLQRTALSTNVKERLDFSCALFDAAGALVANAAHIPVHLGAMQECVRCLLADLPGMKPGEVYITNDPFRGGSHLPDVTTVTPIFSGGGSRPAFFTASRAHHAEIGGITPGSLPPGAKNLAEEGVLIRAFCYDTAEPAHSDAALRALLLSGPYPTRSADENLADLHAQIAANQAGATLLAELIDDHSLAVVQTYAAHLRNAAEHRMRGALSRVAQLAGAPRRFEDTLDDGTPLAVAITARADGSATVDFTGSGAVHPGNLNANRAIVASAVIYCLRCLLGEPIPLNAGLLAPVEIIIPPGTLLDPAGDSDPRRCPAVGGGNVETSQRLVDVILGALDLAAASQGTMNNLLFGRGDCAAGPAFGYYETIGGGAGAGPGFAGAGAVHVHMTNTRLTDPEVLECRYPVRLREWSIRRGSGGAGEFPGGDGMVREMEFLAALDVSLLTSRRTTAPYGAHGGEPGQPGRNLLRRAGAADFSELPPAVQINVGPGDVLRIETPGGGGWGESSILSPEKCLARRHAPRNH